MSAAAAGSPACVLCATNSIARYASNHKLTESKGTRNSAFIVEFGSSRYLSILIGWAGGN